MRLLRGPELSLVLVVPEPSVRYRLLGRCPHRVGGVLIHVGSEYRQELVHRAFVGLRPARLMVNRPDHPLDEVAVRRHRIREALMQQLDRRRLIHAESRRATPVSSCGQRPRRPACIEMVPVLIQVSPVCHRTG